MGLKEMVPHVRHLIEPVQLLYVLMFSVSLIHMDKIYIDKVCQVNLKQWIQRQNLTIDICQNLTRDEKYSEIQNRTQEIVSELKTYEGIMMTAPAIMFSLYAGSYSDRKGRKLLLAVPFLSNILSYLAMLINLYWWDQLSAEWLLMSGVAGLSGGYVCFNIGVYSFTADVSKPDKRTARMSILNGIFSLGFVIGIQAGSAITSYWTVFILSTVFGFVGLLYTLVVIQEKLKVVEVSRRSSTTSCSSFRDSFQTAIRERKQGKRMLLLVLLASFFALMTCLKTGDFDYLMTRLKFSWTASHWGNFLTVQRVTRLISLIVILPFLSTVLNISDSIVIVGGLIITNISYIFICTTNTDWMMYVAATLQMNSVTTVSIRSQLSKLVEPDEIGKIFAVVGIGQSVVTLVSHSIFGAVYRVTLSILPTAYLIIVIFSILSATIAVIIVLSVIRRRYSTVPITQITEA